MALETEYTDGEAPFEWEATGEAEPVAPEEPEAELTLDDLDEATREKVAAYYGRQEEKQRERLKEFGLELNAEGRPLIADAGKVAGWAGVDPSPRREPVQPATPAPMIAAPAPEAEEEFDPLSADAAAFRRLAQREAEKLLAPLQERNAYLEGLVARRAQSEALASVKATVVERIPELAPMLEHPDFEATYRQQIASVPPEFLENPVTVASIAAMVRAQLDPARMPAPRDAAGRFAGREEGTVMTPAAEALARNAANRQTMAGTPGARGGSGSRNAPDPQAELGARFLAHMRSQLSPGQQRGIEASVEAYEEAGITDFEKWQEARAARLARAGRRK